MSTNTSLSSLHALVADRHSQVRVWLRDQLSEIGISSVVQSYNLNDLIRKLSGETHFDLIICDHQLDDKKDGEEVLTQLRQDKLVSLRTVFFIVTGENLYANVVIAAEHAPDDYLLKPFTSHTLARRISRALVKKKMFDQTYAYIEAGKMQHALDECETLLHMKYSLDALRIKAELLGVLGRFDEAAVLYKSIAESRGVPWARLGYAWMLQVRGDYTKAAEEAKALNESNPEYITVYDFLSNLHREMGDFKGAIAHKERALSITKGDTKRLRELVVIASDADDKETQASALHRIIDKTKKTSSVKIQDFLSLNHLLLGMGKIDESEKLNLTARVGITGVDGRAALLVATANVLTAKKEQAKANLFIEEAEKITANLPVNSKSRGCLQLAIQAATTRSNTELAKELKATLASLKEQWSESVARRCRTLLVVLFTACPKDRSVIGAHIEYNSLAAKNNAPAHTPTKNGE